MESSGCTTQPIAINPPHDTPLYPPSNTGPLPALRLSPLPISTGSQDATHSRFRFLNYRNAGQTARSPPALYYPVAVARASQVNGSG